MPRSLLVNMAHGSLHGRNNDDALVLWGLIWVLLLC